ncbi:MAG: (2Fe-2S)-binding protein [Cytophagales bacterium]|nr:(2Fe-2S)-binding protein [Cytophagales bacterium]
MVKIVIENLGQKEVTGNAGSTVLTLMHQSQVDWMHACGGKGRCTTCKFVIVAGSAAFKPLTPAEELYRIQGELAANERLACQAAVVDTCRVRIPQQCKLPHLNYTD